MRQENMAQGPKERKIKSVEQACKLIEIMMDTEGGVTVSELAEKSDRSIGSVHTYLMTLLDQGIINREGDRFYLGPKLITIGAYVLHRSPLYQASRDEVNRLARDTGETVHVVVKDGNKIVSIYEHYGPDAREVDRHERKRERHQHFHATAAGKAYLAFMPENEVQEIIDHHGLPEITPNTITTPEALFEELDQVRRDNYSVNDEEQVIGMRAIGTPIRDQTGDPIGTISISAPRQRMVGERFNETLPEKIQSSASVIEMNLPNTGL